MMLWHVLFDGTDLPAGLFLWVAALIVILAFTNDDDLPGPRRCFARNGGPRIPAFGSEG
ncbi:MAG TPA: hypothetical protein VKJ00_00845 [Thermoanaerobaculia bacterium]|nr:hypothetical protein [Thermoanaerobaculia bacterium]